MVRSDHATGAHRPVEALGIAIVSVDVFLPVPVWWCLADFGIARYGEATTAADTRKYHLTRPVEIARRLPALFRHTVNACRSPSQGELPDIGVLAVA